MKQVILFVTACVFVTMACNIGAPVSPAEPPEVNKNDDGGGSLGSSGTGGNGDTGETAGLTSGVPTDEPAEPQSLSIGGEEDIPDDVPDHLFFGGLGLVSGLFGCYDVDSIPDTVEILQYPSGKATKRNCFCSDTTPTVGLVPATLTLPDGTVINADAPVTEWEPGTYCAEFNYSFDTGMMMDAHTVEMNLSGDAISYHFIPVPGYLFYGYEPNELVRLLVFTDGFGGEFIAERFMNADEAGEVYVRLTPNSTWPVLGGDPDKDENSQYPAIVAFGETTACKIISPGYSLNPNLLNCNIELEEGEEILVFEDPLLIPIIPTLPSIFVDHWTPCKGAPTSRLNVGDLAYPPLDPVSKNGVFLKPDHLTKLLGQIVSGEKVEILDGPECNKDRVWWLISSFSQDLIGWTAEGDELSIWLVPSD